MLQVTIGRTAGETADSSSSVDQLRELIDAARQALQPRGIVLPEALIQSDDRLTPDSVVSYIGLERHFDQGTSIQEFAALLTERVTAIATPELGQAKVQALLAQAVASVAADNYEQALSEYSRAYYHSEPEGYQAEIARCLNDTGNIYLMNGDLTSAAALLLRAAQVSHEPSSDAASLRPQTTLSLASAQLLAGRQGEPTAAAFRLAGGEACDSGSSVLAFVALVGWARACRRSGDNSAAATALTGAAQLVATAPGSESTNPGPAHTAAGELADAVSQALAAISDQHAPATGQDHDSAFGELLLGLDVALTSSLPAGAACKLFKVNNSLSVGLFGVNFNMPDPVFNGVSIIDETIIQNMKLADDTIIQNMKISGDTIIQNMKVADDTIIQNMKMARPQSSG